MLIAAAETSLRVIRDYGSLRLDLTRIIRPLQGCMYDRRGGCGLILLLWRTESWSMPAKVSPLVKVAALRTASSWMVARAKVFLSQQANGRLRSPHRDQGRYVPHMGPTAAIRRRRHCAMATTIGPWARIVTGQGVAQHERGAVQTLLQRCTGPLDVTCARRCDSPRRSGFLSTALVEHARRCSWNSPLWRSDPERMPGNWW